MYNTPAEGGWYKNSISQEAQGVKRRGMRFAQGRWGVQRNFKKVAIIL